MTGAEIIASVRENYEDEELLTADGFEDAAIGLVSGACRAPVVCYDYERCVLIEKRGMDETEAYEYMEINVVGAYVGEKTPLFVHDWRNEKKDENKMSYRKDDFDYEGAGLRTVKGERTHWRDAVRVGERHRLYGFDAPASDIDHLILEYSNATAAALIELKHELALEADQECASYRAIGKLGVLVRNQQTSKQVFRMLPFFEVRYQDDFSEYRAKALNTAANRVFGTSVNFTTQVFPELEYARFLYRLRGESLPRPVAEAIQQKRAEENHA